MTPDDPRVDRPEELLVDRALQGLGGDEEAELRGLVDDPEGASMPMELAAAELDLALGPAGFEDLPASLRRRLEQDADAAFARRADPAPARSIVARVHPWLGWAAAAASLLFALEVRREGPAPGPRVPTLIERLVGAHSLRLSTTDHPLARGGGGELVWSGDRQEGYLALRGLAEVTPDRGVYQLWIFDATRDERFPVDGGTFVVLDESSTTLVPIRPSLVVRRPTLFAITLEPPGGVVVSDRKRILLTASESP